MTKTPATPKNTIHPCACSEFSFVTDERLTEDGDVELAAYTTGCAEVTKRTFAMGHDAKLVGFLVRAELARHDIRRITGGVAITTGEAVDAAARISDKLAIKALIQLEIATKKATKAKTPRAAKPAKVAGPIVRDPDPIACRGKVGRWTYDGVELADGSFRYAAKLGGVKVAAAGSWTRP